MPGGEPRHPRRLARLAAELVVLLVLAVAFGSFQYDVARRLGWAHEPDPSEIAPPPGLSLPGLPALPPVAVRLPTTPADPAAVRAALAPYLRDRDLGRHVAVAVATTGGATLFDNHAGTVRPASTMKLLTTTAALESLGPETTFTTSVVRTGRSLVLVGGGDPLLASTPSKDYPRQADLRTLARDAAGTLLDAGIRRVRLGFDDSLFSGPATSPAWPATYDDVVAPITALWADQGTIHHGPGFEDDPAAAAADAFSRELARAGVKVVGEPARTRAPDTSTPVASVESPPLWQIVDRVLLVSDNEGAEVLAHQVGLAEGFGGSFAGGVRGVTTVLGRLGLHLAPGDRVFDGSGLSRRDRLHAETLLDVLALASSDDHGELRPVVAGLPVAGFTGSLTSRFGDGNAAGPGRVRAKTGTLSGVHGLAGVTETVDGILLSFVVIADRVRIEDTLDARDTLDRIAAALAACHCG